MAKSGKKGVFYEPVRGTTPQRRDVAIEWLPKEADENEQKYLTRACAAQPSLGWC